MIIRQAADDAKRTNVRLIVATGHADRSGPTDYNQRLSERRAAAVGFPPYPYKLVVFVIAGGIAGLAGALMAEHAKFVNPSVLSWQLSGELLAMVILGSANTLIGPILGAAFFLAFRDVLSDYTEHWMLFFGPLLVARVLLMRDGIWGMLLRAIGAGETDAESKVDFPELSKPPAKPSAESGAESGAEPEARP